MSIRYTEPKFFLVAEPKLNWHFVTQFLREAYPDFKGDALRKFIEPRQNDDSDCDLNTLAEIMSRLCYRSFDVSLNPNLTRVRQDQASHIANLLAVRHMAIFEHIHLTFVFTGVSRVFTHELVRHRIGAYSQESLRYVRLDQELPFRRTRLPQGDFDSRWENVWNREIDWMLARQQEMAGRWVEALKLDDRSSGFHWKKVVTSALRRWIGMGVASNIGATWNVTQLRHIIEQRTAPEAEEEIRSVFQSVAAFAIERWPLLFSDFHLMSSGRYRAVGPVDEELVRFWASTTPHKQVLEKIITSQGVETQSDSDLAG